MTSTSSRPPIRTLALTVLISLAVPAAANAQSDPGWSLDLGAAGRVRPGHVGADQYTVDAAPIVEGRFGDPKIGLWTTIANTFRHGFVQAFNPTVEGSVRAANVRPDGKSTAKPDVSDVKDDTRAGAPTGRTKK